MKKLLFVCCLAFLLSLPAFAQRTLTGVAKDAQGNPVPGAVVQVEGTDFNAVTNLDGSFSIVADPGQELIVSCLGMVTEKVTAPSSGTVTVVLKDDTLMIDETVVVGYGVTKKRDLAGAVAQVKADDVKAGVISSTAEMLKGRAAGVYVHQNSNEPGGGINIRVRGASSLSSNNEPLYVIDGMLSSADNGVTPEDIESIEILKDAASTAIYGARGANGVVIITTKKGRKDSFQIDYGYNLSTKMLLNPYDLMDAQDIMTLAMKQWKDNGESGEAPYTTDQLEYKGAGTDWIKEMSRNASTQTHNISMSAGFEKVQAAATIGYLTNKGTIESTGFDRFNGRVNVDFKPSTWLRAGVNAFIASTDKQYLQMGRASSDNNVMYALFMESPLKLNDDSGKDVFGRDGKRGGVYNSIKHSDNNYDETNAYVTGYVEADLVKGLTARAQYSYNSTHGKRYEYYDRSTTKGADRKGVSDIALDQTTYQQFDGVLTYQNIFADRHNLKVIAGTSWLNNSYEYYEMYAHGFSTDAFKYYNMGAASAVDYIASSRSDKTNISFFGRAEYVFNGKYVLNASYRADGASNFGKDNKWGYFPSVSAAWQIGDEDFMDFTDAWLTSLKLRASWGRSGNDGIGNYKSLKSFSFGNVYTGGENVAKGMYLSNAGNQTLKWETTSQLDFGFDASVFDGKVELIADWYKKRTTDLLNQIVTSYSTLGLESTIGNNGVVSNTGAELYLKYYPIDRRNFTWSTTLTLGYNKSMIESINQTQYLKVSPQGWYENEKYIELAEGNPLSAIYGYKMIGIKQKGQEVPTQPKSADGDPIFEDIDGDGIITANDREVLGVGTPPVQLGWGNNFTFGNFDLSFFFDGSFGNKLLNLSSLLLLDNDRSVECMDRWTMNNPSTTVIRTTWKKNAGLQYGSFVNSNFVEDASFIRLSNIELGYNIPTKKLNSNFIKKARVYVGGQRLFTITKYTGFDPEVSTNGSDDVAQGLDYAAYPSYRTINCGVKITF